MARAVINALLGVLVWLTGVLVCMAFGIQSARAASSAEACQAIAATGMYTNLFCGYTLDPVQCPSSYSVYYDHASAYCAATWTYNQFGPNGSGYYGGMTGAVADTGQCQPGDQFNIRLKIFKASGGTAAIGPKTPDPSTYIPMTGHACYKGCEVEYDSQAVLAENYIYWDLPYDPANGPVWMYVEAPSTTTGDTCSDSTGTPAADVSADLTTPSTSGSYSGLTCVIDQTTGQCVAGGTTGGGTTGSTNNNTGNVPGSTSAPGQSTGDGSDTTGFCVKNPTSAVCQKGAFGGTCKTGFQCQGDAVQCAQAQAAYTMACAMQPDESDPDVKSALAAQAASAPDVPASSVDFSLSTWTNQVYGPNSGCPADYVLNSAFIHVVIPFSRYCELLNQVGLAGNAISMLIGLGIVFGRKASGD